MAPERVQAIAEPAVTNVIAAGSALASVLSIAQGWAVGLLGVPLGVPLAAIAGVLYGVTFRDPMTARELWGNIIGCTVLGSVCAPLAGYYLGTPVAGVAGLAAVIGFLTQYSHSWLQARRDRLFDAAADRVLGPSDHGEGGKP